jgi:CheY-like chemotaxis protein
MVVGCVATDCAVRCLIVDDSADFRAAASTMLQRGGITVVGLASNSTEALQFCQEQKPDVALVDVDLGCESGFDVAETLLSADLPAPLDVILISTYAEQDLAEMISASPAVGFLAKFALSATAVREMVAAAHPGDATG